MRPATSQCVDKVHELSTLRVLVVEDSELDAALLLRQLRRHYGRVESVRVATEAEMRAALATRRWDVVVSEWSLPAFSGARALELSQELGASLPFIAMSGRDAGGESAARAALRAGARDFVPKRELARMPTAIDRELWGRCESEPPSREVPESAAPAGRAQTPFDAGAMEVVATVTGSIAHDFNNLLSVVLGKTSLVLGDVSLTEPLRAELLQIHAAGVKLMELTRDLQTIGRCGQVVTPSCLDLNGLLRELRPVVKRILGEDIFLSTFMAVDLDQALVDPGQMKQVVVNLLLRARDAMPRGGILSLETANAALNAEATSNHHLEPGQYVVLSVCDTGGRLETPAPVTDSFFTAVDEVTAARLGLSAVLEMVKSNRGQASVHCATTGGTVVRVYLPRVVRVERPTTDHLPGTAPASVAAETILLVEDDEAVRAVTSTILKRNGYDVLEARSPGEALLVWELSGTTIDLLLADVVLPEMGGLELHARLAGARPGLRVLYMSGYSPQSLGSFDALDAEVAFLEKPITPASLLQKVRTTLDDRRAPDLGPATTTCGG